MCGICGYINRDGRPASADIVRRMSERIIHRGPDDSGEFARGAGALGFRRLSIIDLAGGHQPMTSAHGPQVIVFNGEIFNHRELRRELEGLGATYHTNSDTETILIAFQFWGPRAIERLRGMFALAIYNPDDGALFIARDRLGKKPLYIYRSANLFAFGSEIKALLAHPEISAEINSDVLPVQLALKYTLDDQTLFRNIRKLPPATYLTLTSRGESAITYWDLSFTPKRRFKSDAEALSEFRERFTDAVSSRLLADVPLGMFLSGGIDSSVIAASMSRLMNAPITSFSVAFENPKYNEFEYSRAVARHIGANLREVVVTPEMFFRAWGPMVYHEDEPLAHPSSIPLHYVSALARREVKVVLTGEGADELLAGYERYYQTVYNLRFSPFAPKPLRALARRLIDLLPDTFGPKRKAVRTSLYLGPDIDTIFLDNYASMPRSMVAEALRPEWRTYGVDGIYAEFERLMGACDADNLLERLLYADIKTYLVELLMKQDQMSMSASIESRVPFLDHEFVEFVCRLPVEWKLKGFTTKRILRMALGDTIPPQIVSREKRGFPTPIREWFRESYYTVAHELLLGPKSLSAEYFDRAFVRSTLERHRTGEWNLEEPIWTMCNLEIWLRIFLDGRSPESVLGVGEEASACVFSG